MFLPKGLKIFLIPFTFSSFVNAAPTLLDSAARPKVTEVLDEHTGYVPESGIPITGDRLAFDNFAKAIAYGAPQFIIKLEILFKNPERQIIFLSL